MGTKTGIEWTDSTWNPIRGCSRVSEGCRNCYAEKVAYRFKGPGQAYDGLAILKNGHASWTGKIKFVEKHLLDPLKWRPVEVMRDQMVGPVGMRHMVPVNVNFEKRPRRIFVNSMSDLFHENVEDQWLYEILAVMWAMGQHQYQVLTKRPALMKSRMAAICLNRLAQTAHRQYLNQPGTDKYLVTPEDIRADIRWPLPNLWLGVSVEDQSCANERIPLLLQTRAAIRFISAEPLLGNLDIERNLGGTKWIGGQRGHNGGHYGDGSSGCPRTLHHHCDDRCGRGLDWVICGGESGPGARQMQAQWARSLRDQCLAASVPFFFKQWGAWAPGRLQTIDGAVNHTGGRYHFELDPAGIGELHNFGKKATGSLLDGVSYKQFPEVKP